MPKWSLRLFSFRPQPFSPSIGANSQRWHCLYSEQILAFVGFGFLCKFALVILVCPMQCYSCCVAPFSWEPLCFPSSDLASAGLFPFFCVRISRAWLVFWNLILVAVWVFSGAFAANLLFCLAHPFFHRFEGCNKQQGLGHTSRLRSRPTGLS